MNEKIRTLILHCTKCHHELEVVKYEGQKCDWCGAEMEVIGKGTEWPSVKEMEKIKEEIEKEKEKK